MLLVTLKVPRWWRARNNEQLRACARRHAHVELIGWYWHSRSHPGWFYPDGFHLRPEGRRQYADFVAAQIAALT